MARNRYGVANSFTSSFMQGYSFVDDIQRRNRAEKRLEEEIERQRHRQNIADRRQATLFNQSQEDRDYTLEMRRRLGEASALLADPDVSADALKPYLDIPQVSAFLSGRTTAERADAEMRQDLENVYGLNEQGGVGGQGNEVTQQQQPGGLVAQVAAAAPPGAPPPRMSPGEIQALSFEDPQAAQKQRDAQMAHDREMKNRRERMISETGEVMPQEMTPLEREEEARRKTSSLTESAWNAFADANDPGGDQMRQLPSETLVSQYWEARQTMSDPEKQGNADLRMRPHIAKTIESQRQILDNPEVLPDSLEARNAQRKLSRAMGLAQTIGVHYDPLRSHGVNSQGIPIGRNQVLADNVVNSVGSDPGFPMPPHPGQQAMDINRVNRGTTGRRVSPALAASAFRLYKNGRMTIDQYASVIRTGRLPAAAPEIKAFSPEDNVYATYADGTMVLLQAARKLGDSDSLNYGRNLIGEDGLAQLNKIAGAYDDETDDARGTRLMTSFFDALQGNEQRAAMLGYRLDNVNDTIALFKRWTDLHVLRDAYNDEWFVDGRFNPDFTTDYGTLPEVLLNPEIDQQWARDQGLEVPGSTFLGMGGQAPEVGNVRPRPANFVEMAKKVFPYMENYSPEEIDAVFRGVGR